MSRGNLMYPCAAEARGAMKQQIFEFLRVPAQKLAVSLHDAVRQELLWRWQSWWWRLEGWKSNADERRAAER